MITMKASHTDSGFKRYRNDEVGQLSLGFFKSIESVSQTHYMCTVTSKSLLG